MLVQTELGDIVLEVDAKRAPSTAANFLRYLDAGHYEGGTFHRTVKMDNQPDSPVKIEVIQAGVNADRAKDGFPPIPLERTSVTGLSPHRRRDLDGARRQPTAPRRDGSSASTISRRSTSAARATPTVRASPPSGASCAAWMWCGTFSSAPNTDAQRLTPPIKILKASRVR